MLSVLLTTRRILTEALRARTPTRSPKDTSPQLEKRVLGQGRAPLRVWRAGGLSGARARTGEWDASRERRKSPAGRSVNSFCVRGVANLHVLGGARPRRKLCGAACSLGSVLVKPRFSFSWKEPDKNAESFVVLRRVGVGSVLHGEETVACVCL